MEYYIVEFLFNQHSFFAFWYSDEIDKFYTNKNEVFVLNDYKEMIKYADENNMIVSNEQTVIDCEYILNWSIDLDIIEEDMLDFWNISHDLAYSLKEKFCGDTDFATGVYDKLFQSCEKLMQILGRSVETTPWSIEEKLILLKVMKDGIRILKKIMPIS